MKEEFKKAMDNYSFSRNGHILQVRLSDGYGTTYVAYDFVARVMFSRTGESSGGVHPTPFSLLDRESLEAFYEKLIDLGGAAPPLPEIKTEEKPEVSVFRKKGQEISP